MKLLRHLVRIRGHTLSHAGLNEKSIVIDAGAHRGQFSAEMKARYGCQCWLVEANPHLAGDLSSAGFKHVINAALGAVDGTFDFVHRENPEAGGILPKASDAGMETSVIEGLSLTSLMKRIGVSRVSLLKLDIEGAEFELIQKTPEDVLRSIDQITVEFHDFLPEMKGRGLFEAARDRLSVLGFACGNMAFRTHGDVVFLNRRTCGMNAWQIRPGLSAGRWLFKFLSKFRTPPVS